MSIRIKKDFVAGVIYIALALGFLWVAQDYKMGTASRMGPGYFPIVLGWMLCGFGVISVLRSFFTKGSQIGSIAWKKLAVISLGVLVFGALIGHAGLIFALPAMVIISALASEQSQFDWKALLVLVGLTVFCIVVFVKGLGVPMPIFGAWFDGIVPPSWQR